VESYLSLGLGGGALASRYSSVQLLLFVDSYGSIFLGAYPKELNPFPKNQPLPYIGWERGQLVVASLGQSHKARVKPNVLPRLKPHLLVGPGAAWLSRIYYEGQRGLHGPRCHHVGYADPWPS
jgi:hypothetical protein